MSRLVLLYYLYAAETMSLTEKDEKCGRLFERKRPRISLGPKRRKCRILINHEILSILQGETSLKFKSAKATIVWARIRRSSKAAVKKIMN